MHCKLILITVLIRSCVTNVKNTFRLKKKMKKSQKCHGQIFRRQLAFKTMLQTNTVLFCGMSERHLIWSCHLDWQGRVWGVSLTLTNDTQLTHAVSCGWQGLWTWCRGLSSLPAGSPPLELWVYCCLCPRRAREKHVSVCVCVRAYTCDMWHMCEREIYLIQFNLLLTTLYPFAHRITHQPVNQTV